MFVRNQSLKWIVRMLHARLQAFQFFPMHSHVNRRTCKHCASLHLLPSSPSIERQLCERNKSHEIALTYFRHFSCEPNSSGVALQLSWQGFCLHKCTQEIDGMIHSLANNESYRCDDDVSECNRQYHHIIVVPSCSWLATQRFLIN